MSMTTVAENHPFVLRDGRRWASVECAAYTVLTQATAEAALALTPVIDERTKREYSLDECLRMWRERGDAYNTWLLGLPVVRQRMFA